MKKELTIAVAFLLSLFGYQVVFSAPTYRVERSILPEASSTYDLGSSTRPWLGGYFRNMRVVDLGSGTTYCLTADADGDLATTTCGTAGAVAGSSTAGRIAFWDGTDRITGDANLTWSSSTQNLSAPMGTLSKLVLGGIPIVGAGGTVTFGSPANTISLSDSQWSYESVDNVSAFTNLLGDQSNLMLGTSTNIGVGIYHPTQDINATLKVFPASGFTGNVFAVRNPDDTADVFSIDYLGNVSASTGTFSGLSVGSLTGLLKGTSGVVGVATAGTDYVSTTTGNWAGTFDGQEGTWYLDRANHTGTQATSTITNFVSGVRTLLSAVLPLSYNSSTGAFSISQSGSASDGYLSSTDWNTFNGKLSAALISLNGSTSSTQTFATSSDTNLGLTISTASGVHTFTPVWIGTLADGRITSASTWNGKVGTLGGVSTSTISLVAGTDITISTTTNSITVGNTYGSSTWAKVANNLSDLSNTTTARTNLGLTDTATLASSTWLKVANNLSDLNNTSTARTNLGFSAGTGINLSSGGVISNVGVQSLTGTANQVIVSSATGTPTLSTPQDIATTSKPTFAGVILTTTSSMADGIVMTGGVEIGSITTNSTGANNVAIGPGCKAAGSRSICIGFSGVASSSAATVSIGRANSVLADGGIAITANAGATITGNGCVGIGDATTCAASNGFALVPNATVGALATSGIALGDGANTSNPYSVCLGTNCLTDSANQFKVGSSTQLLNTVVEGTVKTTKYYIGGGSAPTIATSTGAGGAGSAKSISGTNTAGLITLTTGAGTSANATIATVTFATQFASAPYCTFSAAAATSSAQIARVYASTTSSTLSLLANTTALTASSPGYNYWYHCLQ